jgi:glutamate carboxypeptidase
MASTAPSPSPALRDGLARLADAQEEMVARTEAWSAINSGSRELAGLAQMRDALVDAFAALPGALERIPLAPSRRVTAAGDLVDDPHGDAIALRVRPDAPIQVALTGHYDTVFPASHPFQTPQRRADGMLHGPGCADMKGGLSVMLAALEGFERLPEARHVGYAILLSPDEEIGSPASAPLLAALGARAQVGMTYEPALASGALVGARKGSGNFSLALMGRAAHVGRAFADGASAVVAAADAALRLHALNDRRDGVTVNIGAIDGGGPVNVVPDRAVVRFNVRAPDAAAQAWAEAGIAAAIAAVAHPGVSIALHGGFTRPPKPLSPALEAAIAWARGAGAQLGLDLQFGASGGVCEGNNLTAAGCPTIDTLGPRGGALHSDEEFALIDSFAERAQLSYLMLAALAEGRFDPRGLRA